MRWRLLITAILAVVAHGAEIPEPSQIYIVSVSLSDDGAAFEYRLIDVRPDGRNSLIRYSRIATFNLNCPRIIVQSAAGRVRNTSPGELVETNNPCAVKPGTLNAVLKKYPRAEGVFEAISFGIVAQCGSSSIVLGLPMPQNVDLERLRLDHPKLAHLWDLASGITDPVFGSKDIFHDRTDVDDATLQHDGETLVPELISGKYDAGLTAAVKRNVGPWRSPQFRSLLTGYRGPVSAAEASLRYAAPQLLNAQAYRFDRFVAPIYPPLAKALRIEGKVELQLSVEPATGEVLGVLPISGHPLLRPSAMEAAGQWRFEPKSIDSKTLNVTLDFPLRCR
jgi:TonB family protein